MPLRDKIQGELTSAMKAKDEGRVATLRMLWSAIRNEEIQLRTKAAEQEHLTDEQIHTVARRLAKQYTDALGDFTLAARADLVNETKAEITILLSFVPAALSEHELLTIVRQTMADTDATGPMDKNRVIGMVMKRVSGRADGNQVRSMIERELSTAKE